MSEAKRDVSAPVSFASDDHDHDDEDHDEVHDDGGDGGGDGDEPSQDRTKHSNKRVPHMDSTVTSPEQRFMAAATATRRTKQRTVRSRGRP